MSTPCIQTKQKMNLLSQLQGARIVFATDEWFASASNLISDTAPVFIPDLFSEQGKVMDGWESRRKRIPGHDWCLISLAWSSSSFFKNIERLEVDTAYFTGNHVPRISVQVASVLDEDGKIWEKSFPRGGGGQGTCATVNEVIKAEAIWNRLSNSQWTELLTMTPLKPGCEETRYHTFDILSDLSTKNTLKRATHVRINYFPDGGVARMKLWANVISCKPKINMEKSTSKVNTSDYTDLVCSSNNGRGIGCSNRHYGEPSKLIQPSTGKDMGDGWETARHPNRPPILKLLPNQSNLCDFKNLMDWCVLALGEPCIDGVKQILVDTKHFKGNFPESVQIEACYHTTFTSPEEEESFLCRSTESDSDVGWFVILPRVKMTPDAEHFFSTEQIVNNEKPVSHVRVSIWPDGGLSRVRIYGGSSCSSGNRQLMRSSL